jgi:hypothetical protein
LGTNWSSATSAVSPVGETATDRIADVVLGDEAGEDEEDDSCGDPCYAVMDGHLKVSYDADGNDRGSG